ncbi:MAG: glycoside hydrolase [Candidatus Melainabacteria bacterium]|nr:glycoside hydrolase [Candidatus Melainabacteria bacterium]
MSEKLSVCFIWHMHQPLYKDRLTGDYLMPWVRLHAIKDYLDMPLILQDFPKIRQTFNLVPSLMEQLDDYGWHDAVDEQLVVTTKPIEEYTHLDKILIVSSSFHANLERQIKPHPSYFELWTKRQRMADRGHSLESMVDAFTNQEYADMSTWLNLAWFDPLWFIKNQELHSYLEQGRNFSLERRRRLIDIERELIRQTIPVYRQLQELGQIEVITSPYYHPILPLLIDSNVARLSNPHAKLPKRLYLHGDDALKQIETGLSFYEEMFHQKVKGMWPSELSVSPAALEVISHCGIKWVVLDEALLTRTLEVPIYRDDHGNLNSTELLCQPYRLQVGDESINILFREVVLSNEISFSYGRRGPQDAASALYLRLKHIQQRLFNWTREGVVVIALDGENCWETYEDDGNPFLRELYKRLSEDNTLNVCTASDYLERNPPSAELHNIHSGSWIGADFHIWIGDPVKNKAWDLLSSTRHFLVSELKKGTYPIDIQASAWEEIYTAEGSDWFWWFGEPNNSAEDPVFDRQFRLRLQNVYKLLGHPFPAELDVPVPDQVFTQQIPKAATV